MHNQNGLEASHVMASELKPLDAVLKGRRLLVGVGPIRNGTTWLFQSLRQHPQIASTLRKEINFFNNRFQDGAAWYLKQFPPLHDGVSWLMDISPHYIDMPDIGDRIARLTADPIILVGIRNPYDRLESDYRRHYSYRRFPVMATNREAFNHTCRVNLVAENIARLIRTFGKDQVIIYNFDDLRQSPAELLDRICEAAGIDSFVPENVERRILASDAPRNKILLALARMGIRGVSALSPRMAADLMFGPLRPLVYSKQPRGHITEDEWAQVFERYKPLFDAELDRLEALLNLDLAKWRMPSRGLRRAMGTDAAKSTLEAPPA
jgi:hypothetical protein